MTKSFLKDLDKTPLSSAGGKIRTFITRFGLVNKICTYISKKYFSIKLLLDKSRVLTVVRPRQNYYGFLFTTAAINRPQLFLHLQISYRISGVQLANLAYSRAP